MRDRRARLKLPSNQDAVSVLVLVFCWRPGPLPDGAEYAVFNEEAVVLLPGHLSFEEAATLPCAAVDCSHLRRPRHYGAAIAKSGSTHQTMVENQRLYASIGYEETERGSEASYDRVYMRKRLCD